jgi:hypothetical protein
MFPLTKLDELEKEKAIECKIEIHIDDQKWRGELKKEHELKNLCIAKDWNTSILQYLEKKNKLTTQP